MVWFTVSTLIPLGLFLVPSRWLRCFGLIVSLPPFFLVLVALVVPFAFGCQTSDGWLLSWECALDIPSLFLLVLTTFLTPVCILASWESIRYRLRSFLLLLFATQFCLVQAFVARDLLIFYLFFEAVAIPVFALVGIWGSRLRRIAAAFRFFLYTLTGSLLMLLALGYLYLQVGSLQLRALCGYGFPVATQIPLFLAFLIAFGVKVPMIPFHVWLPEAHVEAPTAGSLLLAGILLKLGGYGLFRFSLPIFPEASRRLAPLVIAFSLVAILYSSLSTLVQVDLKKIVAYSSVAHMNYATLGLFSLNSEGVAGSLLLMLAHGLISPGLFLCVGFLYDRYGSRLLRYYGGLAQLMPLYASCLFLLLLANLGLPGSLSFVAEFLILIGAFGSNTLSFLVATFGVVLSASYSIWLFNRLCFGPVSSRLLLYGDLNIRELLLLSVFLVPSLGWGVWSAPFLVPLQMAVAIHLPLLYNFMAFYRLELISLLPELFLLFGLLIPLLLGAWVPSPVVSWVVQLLIGAYLILIWDRVPLHGLLVIDPVGRFAQLMIAGGTLLFLLSIHHFHRREAQPFEFPLLLGWSTTGSLLLLGASDWLTVFLSLELSSFGLYALVASRRSSLFSAEAGLKYFLLGGLSSSLFLLGLGLIYGSTGTLSLIQLGLLTRHGLFSSGLFFGLSLVGFGLLFKLSLVPFHIWAPDVYDGAPFSVAAYLSSLSKLAVVVVLIRLVHEVNPITSGATNGLCLFGILSVVLGTVGALSQHRLKRLVAYSGIVHMGYVALALSAGGFLGFFAAVFYSSVHLMLGLHLFSVLLPLRHWPGRKFRTLTDLASLSRSEPVSALSLWVNLLSLAGIPPLAGFFAKFQVLLALFFGGFRLVPLILVFLSVVSAVYYLRLLRLLHFDSVRWSLLRPVPLSASVAASITLLPNLFLCLVQWNWLASFLFP